MKIFDKQLTISDLANQDINEPYGIVYTPNFGLPPSNFISYAESIGGMANIEIAPNVDFNDKITIIKDYIDNGENVFSSSLNQTIRNLTKLNKYAKEEEIEDQNFSFQELIKIYAILKSDIEELTEELDSLFFIMIIMSKKDAFSYNQLKAIYPQEYLSSREIHGCIIPLIADEETFELFKLGVKQTPFLFSKLFENNEEKVFSLLKNSFIYQTLEFMKTKYSKRFLESIGYNFNAAL